MGALAAVTVITVGGVPFVGIVPVVGILAAVAGVQFSFWPPASTHVTAAVSHEFQGSGFDHLRTIILVGAAGSVPVGRVVDAGYSRHACFTLTALAATTVSLNILLPEPSEAPR